MEKIIAIIMITVLLIGVSCLEPDICVCETILSGTSFPKMKKEQRNMVFNYFSIYMIQCKGKAFLNH